MLEEYLALQGRKIPRSLSGIITNSQVGTVGKETLEEYLALQGRKIPRSLSWIITNSQVGTAV